MQENVASNGLNAKITTKGHFSQIEKKKNGTNLNNMHHDIVIEKVGQGAAIISLSVWKSTPLAEVNLNFFWRFFSFLSHSVKKALCRGYLY